MDKEIVAQDIKKQLAAAADPEVLQKVTRLTSGACCVGVTVPHIREIAKAIKKTYELTIADACDLFDFLCVGKCREELIAVIFILGTFSEKKRIIPWERLEHWLPFLDNWETCDQLSSVVAAPLIHADNALITKLFPYTTSSHLWTRRFAAATAANVNHGGYSFPTETRAICDALKNETEPMVKKAVAWALRELV